MTSSTLDDHPHTFMGCPRAPATSSCRKRKHVKVTCYANDTLRIQGRLDSLPAVHVRDVTELRPVEVRRALLRLDCDLKGVLEFDELKAMYRAQIARLGECSVCQTTPTSGEFALFLPCHHAFHRDCIHKWAQDDYEQGRCARGEMGYRPRCPNCRAAAM